MGGTTSTPAAVPVVSGSPDPTWDQKNSGARITLAESSSEVVVGDDKVKQAYNKGKEEGVASFKSSLEQVAAQVYDGVHTKLTEIQADSMQRSRVLAEELKEKLTVPGSIGNDGSKPMPCTEEQSVFLKCMKEATQSGKGPLACREAVDAYSRCAMSP